jgi:hypothetical protein
MLISECPKCKKSDCHSKLVSYETYQETDTLLEGELPCQFSEIKRKVLEKELIKARKHREKNEIPGSYRPGPITLSDEQLKRYDI